MKNFEIVCVDDDSEVLDTIVSLVKSADHIPVGFTDPTEATKYIEENRHKISIIFSDLRMDNINGFDFKKNLPKSCKDIPFVIITGYWTAEMSSEAMAVGIDAFLEKPIKSDIIKGQIESFALTREEMLLEEAEMVEGFLEESSPMLDEIESLILELEESEEKEQPLSVYFRLLHTIKGTASCVGLSKLGDYTHKYEDFIGELRNGKLPVNTNSINVLLSGLDDLKQLFNYVEKEKSDHNLDFSHLTAKFLDHEKILGQGSSIVKSEDSIDSKEVKKADTPRSGEEDKMTVSMGLLNEFMEESGELTVIRNSILKTVKKIESRFRGDKDVEQLNQLLGGMYSVTSNIQGKITEMRKVSLKNTFRPYKRLVRDLTKKLSKEVELDITGEELLVDNIVAKLFSNTLIHILRNSLDHGIETSAVRAEQGKTPAGTLGIEVTEQGEDIVLRVSDDGKGIDPAIIRKLAVEKGLYSEADLKTMSELEIINIIFDSGFSTAEVVSDLSGRGVGMDMVRGSFEDMGGEVYVQSEKGKGSVFTLKVPIPKSVLIINTLSVESAGRLMLFHMDEVAEVVRYENENSITKLFEVDGVKVLSHNGEMIDLIYLCDVTNPENSPKSEGEVKIVILRVGESKFGVIVDQIFEFEEVVLRKISQKISSHQLYHGASLVGAGEVAMIFSAKGIAENIGFEWTTNTSSALDQLDNTVVEEKVYEYMQFNVGGETLCAELDMVERFEKVSKDQVEYIGDSPLFRYNNSNLLLMNPAKALGLTSEEDPEFYFGEDGRFDVIVLNDKENNIRFGLAVQSLGEITGTKIEANTETIDMAGLKGSVYLEEKTICIIDVPYLFYLLNREEELRNKIDFEFPMLDEAA